MLQWDLVCDKSWIPNVATSVQMAGVLVGAVASGQLGDLVGRKWTHYVTLVLNVILNVVEGFSTSWQMFAVLRHAARTYTKHAIHENTQTRKTRKTRKKMRKEVFTYWIDTSLTF